MVNQPLKTYTFRISETGETTYLELVLSAIVINQDNESWDTSNHHADKETDSFKVQYLEVLTIMVFHYNIHCYVSNDSNSKEYHKQSDTVTVDFRHFDFLLN
nr:MAG TPA: hypothetical protein [Caudoviricetes sp.]